MNVLLRTAAAMAAALAALLTSAYAAACAAVCVAIDAATDAAVRAAASAGVFAVFLAASFSAPALADAPPEQLLHDEIDGQEYQTAVTAATHPDGSWTTVWVDYRSGYPALFSRIFEANGSARGDGNRLTDGRSLFQLDLNAAQVGEPSIASLGDGRSLLVWDDERDDRDRIRAALLDTEGRVTATRTVSSDSRPDSRSRPQVAISGDRALVVWREGEASFSRVWGQLIALDLDLILPGNFRIDPEQDVRQADPRVIPSQDGWIVAWVEGDAEARVRLQRLDSIGTAQGDPAGVEEQPGWSQGQPAVLAVDDGAFVVWTSSNEGQVDLRAVTLDENLQPLSPAFAVISLGATVTPSDPAAGRLDATTLLVLWTGGPASHSRFYERRVELPGSPEGDFAIVDDPENPPGDVLIPHSLGTAGGGDLPLRLSWSDDRDGWQSVFQVEVGEDGSPQADPERIEPVEGSASQVLPSVDLFADGRAFAVWEDFRSGALSIYGRYLDDQGRPAGAAAFRISEGTGGSVSAPSENLRDLLRNRPSVGALADGRAVVAWTAILPGGRPSVALQNFEASGEPLGNNSGLPEVPEARQSDPRILPLPNGQYMIVWRDTSFETAGDIVGQIFDSDGTPAAGEDTIQIVPARYRGASQYGPAVASADAGEVLVAWLDDRALLGNYDVYAQRFNQSGQKIESNLRITPPEGTRPIVQANVTAGASADRYVVAWDEDPLGTCLLYTSPS
ncbi:MAG: hypothetical protein QUU85_08950, partial [Candidatus Eisenbacteria bacterium]|nr:hypothetical protein [Candidatus Eisenbacteria bacterium]